MRMTLLAKGASVAIALTGLVAVAGCDTNYYGDGGARTVTTTTAPVPAPTSSTTSTTTVQPNYDGSQTMTTEKTYRNY